MTTFQSIWIPSSILNPRRKKSKSANLRLDELHALLTDVFEEAADVHLVLHLQLTDETLNADVSARTTHSRTAHVATKRRKDERKRVSGHLQPRCLL